jgi:hypothetical protein
MESSTTNENLALSRLAKALTLLALVLCVLMLAADTVFRAARPAWAASLSALPLLAIGTSFLIVQTLLSQPRSQLLKNLLLAATFLLWGVAELSPGNTVSKMLDEVVIALFVVDLAWTILPRVSTTRNPFD